MSPDSVTATNSSKNPTDTSISKSIAHSRFTTGEKCLFIHLIVTFALILLLVLIYFVHLCIVAHKGVEVYRMSRRSHVAYTHRSEEYRTIGVVYLNNTPVRLLCNTILIRPMWSVAPAHCVTMRSDPETSSFLPFWVIRYEPTENNFADFMIKRNIPHPNFNRDDFSNNLGLFEHAAVMGYAYTFPTMVLNRQKLTQYEKDMVLVGWEPSILRQGRPKDKTTVLVKIPPLHNCHEFLSFIINLRDYEFCVEMSKPSNRTYNHGSAYFLNSKVVGFFSWGDRRGRGTPFIIINILPFKEWLLTVVDF